MSSILWALYFQVSYEILRDFVRYCVIFCDVINLISEHRGSPTKILNITTN